MCPRLRAQRLLQEQPLLLAHRPADDRRDGQLAPPACVGYMDRHGVSDGRVVHRRVSVDRQPHRPLGAVPRSARDARAAGRWTTTRARTTARSGIGCRTVRGYLEDYVNPPEFIARAAERAARPRRKPASARSRQRPERDVLGFLMQHAPLESWEADVLGIIREEAYYFLPQMQTKIMNEGWASYWHSKHHDRASAASDSGDHRLRRRRARVSLSTAPGPAQPLQARGRAVP